MIKMDEKKRQAFIDELAEFIGMVGIYLPDDVKAALEKLSSEETQERAKTMYGCIMEDLELAAELRRPLCQDTGVLQFFLEVGTEFPYMADLEDVINEAAKAATAKTPLRPNVVQPLGEHNTGNNVGYHAPYIEYELVPGRSDVRLRMYMAGGGCSLPGRSKVLMPLEGHARRSASASALVHVLPHQRCSPRKLCSDQLVPAQRIQGWQNWKNRSKKTSILWASALWDLEDLPA